MISIGISDDAIADLNDGFWLYETQDEKLNRITPSNDEFPHDQILVPHRNSDI